jgi:transcriptional regulator with XRE-family HTH domain
MPKLIAKTSKATWLRKRRGLTYRKLAKLTGFSIAHHCDVEHGKIGASPEFVAATAAAMGVTPKTFRSYLPAASHA